MHIRIILEFFEEKRKKSPDTSLSRQSSRCVANEQPCLKTTRLCDDLLLLPTSFQFFYVIFSAPISFSLWFPISPSLPFFFFFPSEAFIKFSHPMDCNARSPSVQRTSQGWILDWVAIFFSRGSSWRGDWTHVSCIDRWILYLWATRESHWGNISQHNK